MSNYVMKGVCYVITSRWGKEYISNKKPNPDNINGTWGSSLDLTEVPNGTIEKLIGRKLHWTEPAVQINPNVEQSILDYYEQERED